MTSSSGEQLLLRDVLANAARELETLATKASGIDEAVGDMLVHAGGETRLPVALLQDVDVLRQSLDCMQILIGNLANHGSCDCGIPNSDAARGVYLAAIKKRCLPGQEA